MVDISYSPQIEPDALPGRAYPRLPDEITPAAFGGQVGHAIEGAGEIAQQHYDSVMAQSRQTQLTDAHNQLQGLMGSLTRDPQTGAFTKEGKNAFGLNQQYLPQYDEAADKIVQSVADPRARQAALLASQQVRNQLSEQLDTHELEQHKQYSVKTAQDSVKIAADQAASNYNHPDIIANNIDTMDVSLENLAHQQGWSDEQLQAARQEAHSSLHTGVLDRMLGDDKLPMAKAYLDTAKNDMDPARVESAARAIDARLKEKQNEAKQDIADRYSDSMQAAQFGLPNAVTVSRKEMDILYPKDAQRRWDGLQSTAEAGAQARQYDRMSPQEIQDDLQKRMPTQGGPEAAFQIHNYETLARAADQSFKARAQDPAQFAIDSGSGWKPLDLSDPKTAMAELRSRANSAPTVSEQVGAPLPLLTKPEAKQVSASLDNSPPAQRIQLLETLHQSLPDDRAYFSVLRQIAPHSPVTAIVGSKVGQPDPIHTPAWYDPKFGGNPADAERILAGDALLNPPAKNGEEKGGFKGGFPMPKETPGADLQSYFADQTKDLFRSRPELADAYYSTFRAAYAGLAAEKGDYEGQMNTAREKQAYQMAIGHTLDFNGQRVMVPQGMDPTRFKGLVDKAVSVAAPAYGAPADWRDKIGGYQLRELDGVGSGKYELLNGNMPIVVKGKPFSIDLHAQYQRQP